MAFQPQYKIGVGPLRHDGTTNPAQSGSPMGECCCNLDACQWAIDWFYVCIGRCYGDPAEWTETQTPSVIASDVHNPAAWAASTAYTTPGQLVVSGGNMYGLKIKHTSGASFDADYWIDASGWVAYQNGASGTVTPATYPDANAYQKSTDASVQGAPPAPGIHCAGHPGVVGQGGNLNGCSATRYGALHGADNCPATPDVSMDIPTACEHSAMCGACVQCGVLPIDVKCYEHNFTPGVLPCSLSVSYDFTVTSTGQRIQGTKIISNTDCSHHTSFPYASTRFYHFRGDDADIPACPGGAIYLQTMDVYYFINGITGTQYWVFSMGWYYCDGGTLKTFSVSGGHNVGQPCNPIVTLTDTADFSPSPPATGMSLVITSNNP
jgi:hypothetical protein